MTAQPLNIGNTVPRRSGTRPNISQTTEGPLGLHPQQRKCTGHNCQQGES